MIDRIIAGFLAWAFYNDFYFVDLWFRVDDMCRGVPIRPYGGYEI